MRIPLVLVLTLSAALSQAQQPCPQAALQTAAQKVKDARSKLLAYTLSDEMDESVPPNLQAQIRTLKDALIATADASAQCASNQADPLAIQAALASLLDANKPLVIASSTADKAPGASSHVAPNSQVYGADLKVTVTQPLSQPPVILVEFSFGICCGVDSMLLAYEVKDQRLHRVVRWQSSDYSDISGAFGDFFSYQVLPQQQAPGQWLLAIAHGHPWCTSNMSAFEVDVLRPSTAPFQQTVFHDRRFYRREIGPVMKPSPNGFQLRMTGNSLDMDIVMRPVIYRYQFAEGQLLRVQPIAVNGRDFVDEWLQSPWHESASWSAASNIAQLEAMHKSLETPSNGPSPNAADLPNLNYGPVRGCTDSPAHFQVELDESWWANQQLSHQKQIYFQIEQGRNAFTMLSVSAVADSHCTGANIMPKH